MARLPFAKCGFIKSDLFTASSRVLLAVLMSVSCTCAKSGGNRMICSASAPTFSSNRLTKILLSHAIGLARIMSQSGLVSHWIHVRFRKSRRGGLQPGSSRRVSTGFVDTLVRSAPVQTCHPESPRPSKKNRRGVRDLLFGFCYVTDAGCDVASYPYA